MYKLLFENSHSEPLGNCLSAIIPRKGDKIFLYSSDEYIDPLVGKVGGVNMFFDVTKEGLSRGEKEILIELKKIQFPNINRGTDHREDGTLEDWHSIIYFKEKKKASLQKNVS